MENLPYFEGPADQEDNHPSTTTATATCATCGSAKNRPTSSSSSSFSPLQLNTKREKPFTKLPLPVTSPINWAAQPPSYPSRDLPPLRRCSSVPVPLSPPPPPENAPTGGSADEVTPSPARAGSSGRRGIFRSVSAPENELIAATAPIGESPNSKRLKRMKERMKEISKWCDEVITEVDEEDEDEEENDHLVDDEIVNDEAPKDDADYDCGESEEAVSVEKNGEKLIIHMKCPCSKAYQFLLSGNNCYYKLM